MYEERLKKILEVNPGMSGLVELSQRGIVVISPDTEKYQSDPNQLVVPGYSNKKTISKQFIIDILSDDISFEKIKKVFEGKSYAIVIMFVDERGNFITQYNLNALGLANLLLSMDEKDISSIKDKYELLNDYVSYEKYKEKTKNETYEVVIDGKNYSIPINLIYQFIELDDGALNQIMTDNSSFGGFPLPEFMYAVIKYYESNKIIDKYLVTDDLKERLKKVSSSSKVDIQMINKYLETDDSLLEKINVDSELENLILSDMSPEFNDLEKAIYVYIKMCKILTYDDEFYAVNQKGPLADKHKTIDNIASITPTNNKVVCYEFDAIYSYILHKLGINYKRFLGTVKGNGERGEKEFDDEFNRYSDGHTFLKYRCGKYLVKADSVTTILQGDIMQAKLNQPLSGLICENTNSQSKSEFYRTLHKVYCYIAEREPKISQNAPEKKETFDEIVSQFAEKTDKLRYVDIREKVDILIDKVNSTKMVGIDAYSYLLQLRKILFSPQEQKDNIRITIIRNSKENSAEALAIISLRIPNEKGEMITSRYIFKPGLELIPISKEDLQKRFDNNSMGYVDDKDPEIPGIKR